MKLSEFFNRPVKPTARERKAGILMKILKLWNGFWVCVVEADKMRLDRHQRKPEPKHWAKIRDEFDPVYADLPICTFRDDGRHDGYLIYIENGQHTHRGYIGSNHCRQLDDGTKVMQVLIHFDMDRQQASRLYHKKNSSSKRMPKWNTVEAGYWGGDKECVKVIRTAENLSLITPVHLKEGEDPKLVELHHPNEYVRIVRERGAGMLRKYLKVFKTCLRKEKGVDVGFIRGLCDFMEDKAIKGRSIQAVVKLLRKSSPEEITLVAKTLAGGKARGEKVKDALFLLATRPWVFTQRLEQQYLLQDDRKAA